MTPRFGSGKRAGDKYPDSPPPSVSFFPFLLPRTAQGPDYPAVHGHVSRGRDSTHSTTVQVVQCVRACDAVGGRFRAVRSWAWDWDGRLGRASLGTSEWLPLPIGAGRLGTDSLEPPALLAASCPEMSEPMAGSGHDSRDQRTPTNQPAPTPRRAVLLSLSNDAGRLGLVISTTIRFCTVYGAGARGITDSGLAGLLQPLASSSTHQASMARRGRQVANGEPFGDEAGHSSRHWTQWLGG